MIEEPTLVVGPLVPENIQKIRALRRKQAQEGILKETPVENPIPNSEDRNESSSDDDGDIGPQLPVEAGDVEDEAAALARLQERANSSTVGPESALVADRANWMSVALGGGNASTDISYNPKTFRRNISISMDKSWTETQAERSKRQADEMMGLKKDDSRKADPKKKVKPDDQPQESSPLNDERASMPSLLEEHMAKRNAQQQKSHEEQKEGGSFNWERDIQGKGRSANTKKVAAFVSQAKSMNDKFSRASK